MENINWQEIQDDIEDALWSCLEIDDISEMLVEKLDFSQEDAEEIMDNLFQQVQDAEEQCKLNLTADLCGYLADCVRIRDNKLYPEDAPGQMHLFEME